MIAQLSPSAALRQSLLLEHRREVRRVLLQVLGARRLAPDVQLLEVEPGGPHEDPGGHVVDARLEDVQRVRGHVIALLYRSTSFDLYSLRCRLPHGTSSTRVCDHEHVAQFLTDRLGERIVGRRARRQLDRTGSGGSCFTPGACGLTRM